MKRTYFTILSLLIIGTLGAGLLVWIVLWVLTISPQWLRLPELILFGLLWLAAMITALIEHTLEVQSGQDHLDKA